MNSPFDYTQAKEKYLQYLNDLVVKIESEEIHVEAFSLQRHMDPIWSGHNRPPVGMRVQGYTITIDIFSPEIIIWEEKP